MSSNVKYMILVAAISIISRIASAEVMGCKPVEFIRKETKTGYSERLAPVKGGKMTYFNNGKELTIKQAIDTAPKSTLVR